MTKITDNITFLELVEQPDIFQQARDYEVVLSDDSTESGKRVTFTPDDYSLQTTDGTITTFEFDNLMRIQSNGTASQYIVGMFLCTREANDDEYCTLYSIGSCVPAVYLYPGQTLEVNYTPVYK